MTTGIDQGRIEVGRGIVIPAVDQTFLLVMDLFDIQLTGSSSFFNNIQLKADMFHKMLSFQELFYAIFEVHIIKFDPKNKKMPMSR